MNRRSFLLAASVAASLRAQAERPNILWITCEDMSPMLGCYGDQYASSPNLDKFSERAVRYRTAWSNFPVCAPARTTIISGVYPPSAGAEHMRSFTKLPANMKMYPCFLREAGYYTTNNLKEDYNVAHTGTVWDESSNKAHWRNRKPGQPFFAIFNDVITHESQIRRRPHKAVHDPKEVRVPAYHPDAPEVRQDWAQMYDNIATMDRTAGKILQQLQDDGLADSTIVFFYSDHGTGMPRSKRWPYNSGLQVPMMVHIPEKFRSLAPKDYVAGGWSERLVSFVDLAPTVLSLAGIAKPAYQQGHAFLGRYAEPEQPYLYGFRGRMDERYDMVRSVRDKRYVYIRNYMPHRIYGEHVEYMFEMPTTRKWQELYQAGKLNEAQKHFWEPKPAEELYDLQNDRDEVNNLAGSPAHKGILEKMRKAQLDLAIRICDVGYLPEGEMQARAKSDAPYDMGHDPARYSVAKVVRMADAATRQPKSAVLAKGLADSDSGVRYWAATGFLIAGAAAVKAHTSELEKCLADPSPAVRIPAAEALARFGGASGKPIEVLIALADLNKNGFSIALQSLNALDALGTKVKSYEAAVKALPKDSSAVNSRMRGDVAKAIAKVLKNLG